MATLREMRAERLLTIRELAREASVAPSTIYLIETGRSTPRLAVVRRLATALGVEPHQIDEFHRKIEASKVQSCRRRSSSGTARGEAGLHDD